MLATSVDGEHVQIWSAAAGAPLGSSLAHDGNVLGFEFTQGDQRLEVSLLDGTTYVWATHPPGEARPALPHATSVAAARDGASLLVTDEAGLYLTDLAGHRLRTLLAGPGLGYADLSPDGAWAAVTVGTAAEAVVPTAGGPAKIVYQAPPGMKVDFASFTDADDRLVVVTEGGPSPMIDVATGRVLAAAGDGQENIAFIAHGQFAAFWSGGRAILYGDDGRATPLQLPPGRLGLRNISGDARAGLAATVGLDYSATIFWDLSSGRAVGKVDSAESIGATAVALRPGPGGWIARADVDQSILVWPWDGARAPMIAAPPAKRLAGHEGAVLKLKALPDGRLLSQGQDNRVMIWDPLSGRLLARYDNVKVSRVSADGRRLVLLGTDGVVRAADLPPDGQALIDAERNRAGALTAGERERYFLNASR
jgi:WD40 repeat protein